MIKKPPVNNEIKASKVRLIDEEGKQIGILPLEEALRISRERNLDLIQVTEKLEIPVCKLGDYGKYLYELQKKERKQLKKKGELKMVRLGFNTSLHDLETKANQTKKFLEKGNKVRIELMLKGREKGFSHLGKEKISEFLKILENLVEIKIERELKKEPRGLTMIIAKKK